MDDERVEPSDRDERPARAAGAGGAEPPAQPEPEAEPAAGSVPPAGSATADEASPPPRRGLKLVVTLRPEGAADYRAVLALGADGCDPLLRSAGMSDLQAALDEVPGLLAEAEALWAVQPRNPAARPARAARGAPPHRSPTAAANPATAESAPPAAGPAESARAGQLSFFG